MQKIISIGSGKGGVGKSVISTNLAYLLARSGKSVTLIDLDSGGADLHILMGLFKPEQTLTDFVEKRVSNLNDVALQLEGFGSLKLIVGTGDSLMTANMPATVRSKLLRHIRQLTSEIVIIDVGAGTHFNTLDFFLCADFHVCIATNDPTSVLDLYRFVKLAVIRKALSSFLSYDEISQVLRNKDVTDIEELLEVASEYGADKQRLVEVSLEEINPYIIFNQVSGLPDGRLARLRELLQSYLKVANLELLGCVPEDSELRKSVKAYQPVSSLNPSALSSKALASVSQKISALL